MTSKSWKIYVKVPDVLVQTSWIINRYPPGLLQV